ncbi:MAG: NAD(P)/FAD-dependent oxidoreductase [Proteobacteria bacterium]|nr:NAD(P)/FAD-dependent oxidoreductase [Pseudomonadota bacterium]
MERYDACVIGAGADGLAAAIMLARAKLKTILIERSERPGGRLQTREFHPGFRASPFMDEVAPIPNEIFWSFDLARQGAILASSSSSIALWPGSQSVLRLSQQPLLRDAAVLSREVIERVADDAHQAPPRRSLFSRPLPPRTWPGEAWANHALAGLLAEQARDALDVPHLAALALTGRAADPYLSGSALHLLAPATGGSGMPIGGLGSLAHALAHAAESEGVAFSYGLDVSDLRHNKDRVTGACLADGTEIAARAVITTLDLKRSFLSLFKWNELPAPVAKRVSGFRMAGGTARLLLALERPPELSAARLAGAEMARGSIHIAPDMRAQADAYAAWRGGTVPERPPISLRLVSAVDPSLAPIGQATITVTLGSIPFRLFDGGWTKEKRDQLQSRALDRIEDVLPGIKARLLHVEVIAPPDIEDALGLTEGDLWGGEIAGDQMLGLRPWSDMSGPRTPMRGLYLAGPSSALGPLATCAAGVAAAGALIGDAKAGRLK